MDDRLPKPYSLEQLQAVLRRWLGTEAESPEPVSEQSAETPRIDEAVIDSATLFGLGGGAEGGEALPAILGSAARDLPERLERMERLLAAGAASELSAAAHALKGLSGMIGAHRLAKTCSDIEDRVRDEDLESCTDLVDAARQHTAAVTAELERLLAVPPVDDGEAT